MKLINRLFRILILPLAVLLLFTACQNEVNENSKPQAISGVEGVESTEKGITLKGEIKLSGAVPSRSATTSFSDDITWWIMAMAYNPDKNEGVTGSGNDEIENTSVFTITTSNSFSLTLPEAGNWSITINGYAGIYTEETIPLDSQPVFIYNGEPAEYTADASKLTWTIYPSLNPYLTFDLNSDEGVKKGSINLPVTVNAENVYRVSATLAKNQGTDADTIIVEPQPVSNGKVNITVNNVPFGVYTAEISFEDEPGNTLYSCKEAINVYPGLTTDTWFGTAPYFKNGEFVLSSNMVEGYGADIVPNTNYVLYNKQFNVDEQSYVYQYYLVDDYSAEIPETMTASNSSESYNSLCFDSEGYYYILTKEDEDYICIKSNKPNFGEETASANNGAMKIDVDLGSVIAVDRVTDFLYVFDHSNVQIARITKSDGSYNYEEAESIYKYTKSYSIMSSDENIEAIRNSSVFTVYNNIAYFASAEDDKIAIVNFDNTDTTMDVQINVNTTVPLGLSELTSNATITDILYQNGSLYLIAREFDSWDTTYNEFNVYSRGLIIQYDVLTGKCSTILDLAPTKALTTFKAPCTSDTSKVYNSKSETDYRIEEFTCTSSPSALTFNTTFGNNSDSYLVGPQKFVAIKPKKLVISDTGIAFYTTADGVLSYKNVNRIIEIDLKSLSITENTDVSKEFDIPTNYSPNNTSGLPVKTGVDLTGTFKGNASSGWVEITTTNATVCPFFVKGL